jgi:hypothetical protein
VKITRDAEHTNRLLDGIRASFGRDVRDGIHLSDLLNPRRSAWQRVLPLPPTNAEVLYWTAGRGHEDALGRVSGLVTAPEASWEWGLPGVDEPIVFRNDFIDNEEPVEFKTRRANLALPGEEAVVYDTYLAQLGGYCALRDKTRGRLVVLSLLEGRSAADPLKPTEPELASYTVEYTPHELEQTRRQLAEQAEVFELYLVCDSITRMVSPTPLFAPPNHMRLCRAWMCGKSKKTVLTPAWCGLCKKSVAHREGHSHRSNTQYAHEVIEWSYEPRCKYYALCRPQDQDPSRGAR